MGKCEHCPYAVVVGQMSEEYIQCVHLRSKSFFSIELHVGGNLHLTHNFFMYKKNAKQELKGFYVKAIRVELVKKLLKQDD